MKKIIIDTDPGKDDFLAILMLILSKKVNIQAITTVMGNSTLANVTANTQYLLDLTNSQIPIYAGSAQPLSRSFKPGNVMGKTGLTGVDVKPIKIVEGQAVTTLTKLNRATNVLLLGPQTNLALALKKNPSLESKIKSLVIMGGAINCRGNTNSYAEFNIFTDPEAAKVVFETRIPKVLIPLDLCYQVPLYLRDFERIRNPQYRELIIQLIRPYIKALKKYENQDGAIVYDALAAYYLLNPSAFTLTPMSLTIETIRSKNLGQTKLNSSLPPNILVATSLDKARFVDDFIKIINEGN